MSADKDTSDTVKFYSRNPKKWEAQAKRIFLRKERISANGTIMTIDNFSDPEFDDIIGKLSDDESVQLVDFLIMQEEIGKEIEKLITTADGLSMTKTNLNDPVFMPLLDRFPENLEQRLMYHLTIKDQARKKMLQTVKKEQAKAQSSVGNHEDERVISDEADKKEQEKAESSVENDEEERVLSEETEANKEELNVINNEVETEVNKEEKSAETEVNKVQSLLDNTWLNIQ
jgi:hypothetical protein